MLSNSAVWSVDPTTGKVRLVAGNPTKAGNRTGLASEALFHFSTLAKGALHLDPGHIFEDEGPEYPYNLCGTDIEQSNEERFGHETRTFEHPILLADRENGSIKLLVKDTVILYAGQKRKEAGRRDGPRKEAYFGNPSVITHHRGYFFVPDTQPEHLIRIIAPSGMVTTIGGSKGDIDGHFSQARFNFPYHITPFNDEYLDCHSISYLKSFSRPFCGPTSSSNSSTLPASSTHHQQPPESAHMSSLGSDVDPDTEKSVNHPTAPTGRMFTSLPPEPMILLVSDSDNNCLRILDMHRETVFSIGARHGPIWPRSSLMMPNGSIVFCGLAKNSLFITNPMDPSSLSDTPGANGSVKEAPKVTRCPPLSFNPITSSAACNDNTRRCFDIALNNHTGTAYLAVDNREEVTIITNFCAPFAKKSSPPRQFELSSILHYMDKNILSPYSMEIRHGEQTWTLHTELLQTISSYLGSLAGAYQPCKISAELSKFISNIANKDLTFSIPNLVQTISTSTFPKSTIDMFLELFHGSSITITHDMTDENQMARTQADIIYLYERVGLPVHLPLLEEFATKTIPSVTDVETIISIICDILTPTSVVWGAVASYTLQKPNGVGDLVLERIKSSQETEPMVNDRCKEFPSFLQKFHPNSLPLANLKVPRDYKSVLHMSVSHLASSIAWNHTNSPNNDKLFRFSVFGQSGFLEVDAWVLYPQWSWFRRMIDSDMIEARTGVCELTNISSDFLLSIVRYLYTHDVDCAKTNADAVQEIEEMGALYGLTDNEGLPVQPFERFVFSCLVNNSS